VKLTLDKCHTLLNILQSGLTVMRTVADDFPRLSYHQMIVSRSYKLISDLAGTT